MFRISPPQIPSYCTSGVLVRRLLTFGVAVVLSLGAFQSSMAQNKPAEKPKKDEKPKQEKKQRGKTDETPRRIVLVFPPDIASGGMAEQLTDIIMDVIKVRLSAHGGYRSIPFSRALPTIKRAITEQALSTSEVGPPYGQDAKAKKLAELVGHDIVVVSSIDDYQYDADKNQVSLVMSARLLDFAGGGKIVRAAGESLTSPAAPKSKKEIDVALDTARSLTETLMTQLLKPAKPAEAKPVEKSNP